MRKVSRASHVRARTAATGETLFRMRISTRWPPAFPLRRVVFSASRLQLLERAAAVAAGVCNTRRGPRLVALFSQTPVAIPRIRTHHHYFCSSSKSLVGWIRHPHRRRLCMAYPQRYSNSLWREDRCFTKASGSSKKGGRLDPVGTSRQSAADQKISSWTLRYLTFAPQTRWLRHLPRNQEGRLIR